MHEKEATSYEAENEAEANNYQAENEVEAVKFVLEADPASSSRPTRPRGLNIPEFVWAEWKSKWRHCTPKISGKIPAFVIIIIIFYKKLQAIYLMLYKQARS